MSVVDPCSVWFEGLGRAAWQYLGSPEGGRTIAAVGGVLFILYYLKEGAVPGGRALAVPLAVVFVAFLLAVVLLATASWNADIATQCALSHYT
jgi:hypothetical protein